MSKKNRINSAMDELVRKQHNLLECYKRMERHTVCEEVSLDEAFENGKDTK